MTGPQRQSCTVGCRLNQSSECMDLHPGYAICLLRDQGWSILLCLNDHSVKTTQILLMKSFLVYAFHSNGFCCHTLTLFIPKLVETPKIHNGTRWEIEEDHKQSYRPHAGQSSSGFWHYRGDNLDELWLKKNNILRRNLERQCKGMNSPCST